MRSSWLGLAPCLLASALAFATEDPDAPIAGWGCDPEGEVFVEPHPTGVGVWCVGGDRFGWWDGEILRETPVDEGMAVLGVGGPGKALMARRLGRLRVEITWDGVVLRRVRRPVFSPRWNGRSPLDWARSGVAPMRRESGGVGFVVLGDLLEVSASGEVDRRRLARRSGPRGWNGRIYIRALQAPDGRVLLRALDWRGPRSPDVFVTRDGVSRWRPVRGFPVHQVAGDTRSPDGRVLSIRISLGIGPSVRNHLVAFSWEGEPLAKYVLPGDHGWGYDMDLSEETLGVVGHDAFLCVPDGLSRLEALEGLERMPLPGGEFPHRHIRADGQGGFWIVQEEEGVVEAWKVAPGCAFEAEPGLRVVVRDDGPDAER